MRLTILLIVLLAVASVEGQAPEPFADLDVAIQKGIERGNCPGAVVVVLHRGEVVHRQAYGRAVVQPEVRAMPLDAVFDLASLTKPLATALAIHLLVEQGKLKLDAPVARYRPSFARKDRETLTLEQLLLHTSGFAAGNPLADYREGLEKALAKIDELPLLDPPGTRFRYSDINYILLGHLVEQASGQSLDRFCREKIFEPLGMKETSFCPTEGLRARSVPTERVDGKFLQGVVHDPRARLLNGVAGHAGLFSTADDLTRFAQMVLGQGKLDGKQVIPAAVIRRYTKAVDVPLVRDEKPARGKRTLGFDVQTPYSLNRGERFPVGTSFGHTGFTGPSIWLDPESRSGVIFLSSRVHPDGKGDVKKLRGEIATLAAPRKE